MHIEQIGAILQGQAVGTLGQDMFVHFMPSDVEIGLVLLSSLSGSLISPELPKFRKLATFQVIARAPMLDAAMTRANRALDALTIQQRRLLPPIPSRGVPGLLLHFVRPLHDPQPYPRQMTRGWEVSTNYTAAYVIQGDDHAL